MLHVIFLILTLVHANGEEEIRLAQMRDQSVCHAKELIMDKYFLSAAGKANLLARGIVDFDVGCSNKVDVDPRWQESGSR